MTLLVKGSLGLMDEANDFCLASPVRSYFVSNVAEGLHTVQTFPISLTCLLTPIIFFFPLFRFALPQSELRADLHFCKGRFHLFSTLLSNTAESSAKRRL